MVSKHLDTISTLLRHIVLERWTEPDIVDHVVVKLPAPIFDRLVMEVQSETPTTGGLKWGQWRDQSWFKFGGIKYERVDGRYWSVRDFQQKGQ